MEKFVVEWLLKFVGNKFDPKQFGGRKGSSISHYMIEIIHFILHNQDFNLPVAVKQPGSIGSIGSPFLIIMPPCDSTRA